MALTLFTNPMSRGRIARWMLEEVGAPYETVVVDWADKPKALLEANPMGKLPTIDHDGHIVSEAGAVCAYLAQAFPEAGLGPAAGEAADYYRWLFFVAGPLEAAMTDKSLGVTVPSDKEIMVGYGNFDRTIDTLERAVAAHPFITGERFMAADVYVGSAIGFYSQFKMLPERKAFAEYLGRISERPAYKRSTEIDEKLIAEMKGAR